ncbi:hypothetical protein CD30_15035 [Ureibacillus massiliensis 4400831 = CIP 108448 = CCUG 49529]|uniref:Nuclear transport factor 2 family protein n=1 Tax=Ureibacillus massiliensis 4400831 = CIP 108448 = CCUG 49529 TaxID=1211035 RepID=A0A0A3JS59_9BACL|nr:hypothetical protein [Ureibacillus massiliensis]KGR89817.1 hypothetical protein CD30_15035 [Ureibacillus massiliensis 4400831 = CIP 108448 = CCUG 49529]
MEKSEMEVVIHTPQDCGNSPRKAILLELTKACLNKDTLFISKHITEDIKVNLIGHGKIQGKENLLAFIYQNNTYNITEVTIETIITHGTAAALNGYTLIRNKGGSAFSLIYTFTDSTKNVMIKEITSYFTKV